MRPLFIFFLALTFSCMSVPGQPTQTNTSLANVNTADKMMPSVVVILAGTGSGLVTKTGSGIIVRNDGVILTAYHVVKDATQLQIRLKNGEIYDQVDLIGFDERRDVAALKISGSNLPAATMDLNERTPGEKVYVVSHPEGLNWTVSDGILSSSRMADEIPGAGTGFRVLQFTAPASPGSSGGLLANEKGEAIGLIFASTTSGQNLNFAIPVASVSGLINSTKTVSSFGKGNSLELPQAVRPPNNADLRNADPKTILQNAKFLYIYSYSDLINDQMMENALMLLPEFDKWQLRIVKDAKLADIKINVEHDALTWDYRYSMTDNRTEILLASGKVTVWDGRTASGKFAKLIVAKLQPGREPVTDPKVKDSKSNSKKDDKKKDDKKDDKKDTH